MLINFCSTIDIRIFIVIQHIKIIVILFKHFEKTVEGEHYFSIVWSASIEPCLTMLVDLQDQNKGKYFIVYEIILEAFLKF